MRTWMIVVLALFALGNLAAGLSGHSAGYLSAGMAALGLAGHVYAARGQRRGDSSALGLRLYSMFFAAALALVAVVFTVLAVTSGPEQRGGFTGMAILWTTMATATVMLVVALERRLRKTKQNRLAESDRPRS